MFSNIRGIKIRYFIATVGVMKKSANRESQKIDFCSSDKLRNIEKSPEAFAFSQSLEDIHLHL
jgi:hypothetical protein